MRYVIYDTNTTAIVQLTRKGAKSYKTRPAALAAITRYFRTTPNPEYTQLSVANTDLYYSEIEKQVTRINIMTGLPYTESINTPISCSPASETYWSM